MSYTALYRKFRPVTFDDVKGQDHIVTTLKNQLNAGRIGHAYLFCGTRGTGKTTVAKIFAKAVNCENPKDGSPCGECAMCKAIAAGTSMNVIEIDAASNNGVENIREIIEEVTYPPVEGKYKVYIMDEAHMLSEGARNALLKTLEEPPSYVIFILATTELQRIPITIMSRCQRYDFRRISIDTIAARMKELTQIEGIDADDRALRYVAKAADGSMRDGLSLLDQCAAFNFGEKLTYEKTLEVLGAVDTTVFSELMRLLIDDDVIGTMDLVERVVMQGRELSQFVTDFIWYLRSLMLLKASDDKDMEELLNISPEHLALLKEEAGMTDMETVFRYISVFSELQNKMKFASQKRIMLEMYLIRLTRPQMDKDNDALVQRIDRLEKLIENGVTVVAPQSAEASGQIQAGPAPIQQAKKATLEVAIPEDIKRVCKEWNEIVGRASYPLRGIIRQAELSLGENGKLLLCFSNKLYVDQMKSEDYSKALSDVLNDHIGKEVLFDVRIFDGTRMFDEQFADLLKMLHIEKITEEPA